MPYNSRVFEFVEDWESPRNGRVISFGTFLATDQLHIHNHKKLGRQTWKRRLIEAVVFLSGLAMRALPWADLNCVEEPLCAIQRQGGPMSAFHRFTSAVPPEADVRVPTVKDRF